MLTFALVSIILFEHALAKVTDADHAFEIEALALDDVSCTSTAKDLTADSTMMLSAKRCEDRQTLSTLLCVLISHPELAAETFASHPAHNGIRTCLQADLCFRSVAQMLIDGVDSVKSS